MTKRWLTAAVLFLLASPAWAVGTLVPATNRKDVVHDDQRGLVYITDGTRVLRWNEATGTFLSPIELGGSLASVDISPDNATLVVADTTDTETQAWVHLVDLATLASHKLMIATPDYMEGGTFSAVYGGDGRIYTTSTFHGSGWVSLRRINPVTGATTILASICQDTMLAPSGDLQTIGFAESNISDGRWGVIDVPTGTVVQRQWYEDGTSAFNFEIGTDPYGAQVTIPTYFGAKVYDDAYANVSTLGVYAGAQPIGVVYHPVERIAYFPYATTSEVRVFDMNTFTQTGSYDFQYGFSYTGNHAFGQGRTRISRDGSLLMVTVGGGVRLYRQYAALKAGAVTTSTPGGQALSLALPGSIGNGGTLAYELAAAPAHGTVTVAANGAATYTPAAGYGGTDAFSYRVRYGRAKRVATVAITVLQPNRAPVANPDSAAARNTAISIPVLANDSDPDGDTISLAAVSTPAYGTAVIVGNQVRFTPPKKWPSTPIIFGYSIRDSKGAIAASSVTVRRN